MVDSMNSIHQISTHLSFFSFYKDLVNGQVFYALNFSFSHSESHENSSVHYGKDYLESGTCCILLSVHCVQSTFNLLGFLFKVPWFVFPFSLFFSSFLFLAVLIYVFKYLKNYPSSCQIIMKKKKIRDKHRK